MLPGTERFNPTGRIEKQYFQLSDSSVFPKDVQSDLKRYSDKMVSWTGIIEKLELLDPEEDPLHSHWKIHARHHYYDWLIDHGLQKEKFLLSHKGEGRFVATVVVNRLQGAQRQQMVQHIEKQYRTGNMVIAYGKPEKVIDGVVILGRGFANAVDKKWVSTKEFSYGRVVRTKDSRTE